MKILKKTHDVLKLTRSDIFVFLNHDTFLSWFLIDLQTIIIELLLTYIISVDFELICNHICLFKLLSVHFIVEVSKL